MTSCQHRLLLSTHAWCTHNQRVEVLPPPRVVCTLVGQLAAVRINMCPGSRCTVTACPSEHSPSVHSLLHNPASTSTAHAPAMSARHPQDRHTPGCAADQLHVSLCACCDHQNKVSMCVFLLTGRHGNLCGFVCGRLSVSVAWQHVVNCCAAVPTIPRLPCGLLGFAKPTTVTVSMAAQTPELSAAPSVHLPWDCTH